MVTKAFQQQHDDGNPREGADIMTLNHDPNNTIFALVASFSIFQGTKFGSISVIPRNDTLDGDNMERVLSSHGIKTGGIGFSDACIEVGERTDFMIANGYQFSLNDDEDNITDSYDVDDYDGVGSQTMLIEVMQSENTEDIHTGAADINTLIGQLLNSDLLSSHYAVREQILKEFVGNFIEKNPNMNELTEAQKQIGGRNR